VILDLDVFKGEADMVSDEDVWGLLETLRNRKNEFFEGCITDKTRERILTGCATPTPGSGGRVVLAPREDGYIVAECTIVPFWLRHSGRSDGNLVA